MLEYIRASGIKYYPRDVVYITYKVPTMLKEYLFNNNIFILIYSIIIESFYFFKVKVNTFLYNYFTISLSLYFFYFLLYSPFI